MTGCGFNCLLEDDVVNQVYGRRRSSLWAAVCATVRQVNHATGSGVVMELNEPRRLLANAPLSALPLLHSYPQATAKLFLDFDGDPGLNNWLGIKVPATPAFDRDGDPKTFSTAEIADIKEVW